MSVGEHRCPYEVQGTSWLDGLSEAGLRRVRNHEQGNRNRETLIAEINCRITTTP
jgi:hypothetical protein